MAILCAECVTNEQKCPACSGTGRLASGEPCDECGGTGTISLTTCASVTCANFLSPSKSPPISDGH